MGDLIERQAAIDALAEHEKSRGHNYTLFVDIVSECAEIIRNLPSAQLELIRCKDCKYASPNGKYGCKAYHFKRYETHEMEADDFCSRGERREEQCD